MADDLDSLVKGAPLAGTPGAASLASAASKTSTDPLHNTPSSPSMIYLNLLVLEASLRAQYLELRARRRHHTFFLLLLVAWTSGFGYALFFAPREDGRGQGGSVYWAVEVAEKLCFMGGVITGVLVWGTGIWDRGVRWPRRWFVVSNRGLRAFNCKLVLLKRTWWAEQLSTIAWFLTYGLFSTSATSSYRYVDAGTLREVERDLNISQDTHQHLPIIHGIDEEKGMLKGHDEDLAPGGDYVKLLLLPKPFSPTFRENWELYRSEYWERENERRALLRDKLKERDKRLSRLRWGWWWWFPWRKSNKQLELEDEQRQLQQHLQQQDQQHQELQHHHAQVYGDKAHHARHSAVEREHKRARSGSIRRGSVSSTRSPTPTIELAGTTDEGGVSRRASTASSTASERRKKKPGLTGPGKGPLRRPDSRSVTPDFPSPLARTNSIASDGTDATEGLGTRTLGPQTSQSSVRSL